MRPELRLLNLHFFNICRHHPTLKFKPHATDDERYVSGIDGVPLTFGGCQDKLMCSMAKVINAATRAWGFQKYAISFGGCRHHTRLGKK